MAVRDWLKRIVAAPNASPSDVARLPGTSEHGLGVALRKLPKGERGWITLAEAARLFSTEKPDYAFGEMDEPGQSRLETFAAEQRSFPEYMPVEGRVYFTRKS